MSSLVLALVLVLGSGHHEAQAQDAAATSRRAVDDVERLREKLRLPGPEGRRDRENAVQQILSMRGPEAHALLQDALRRGDDEDGLSRYALHALAARLENARDPVFAPANRAERSSLHQGYVPALVAAYATDGDIEGPLVPHARSCLLALDRFDLQEGLTKLVRGTDAPLRRAALRAAADARSLNLAPLLADWLEDQELGALARSCLARLTFQGEPFRTKAEFARWYEENKNEDYIALAEQAARASLQRLDAASDDARKTRRELTLELIEAYASRPDVAWKRLEELALGAGDDLRLSALQRLRDVLAASDRPAGLGGVTADRLALLDALARRNDETAGVSEQALLLEISAHLVDAGDKEEVRKRPLERLVAGLGHEQIALRLSALAGLRRHPSPERRAAVIALIHRAAAARDEDSARQLAAGLSTLQAKGWTAPKVETPECADWLSTLSGLIADASLPKTVREHALQVLMLRDPEQKLVDGAFDILVRFVADAKNEVDLRERAMIQLGALAGNPQRSEPYVESLIVCLADEHVRLRERAATLLVTTLELPARSREKLSIELLNRVRERLVVEPDPNVLKSLIEVLKQRIGAGSLAPQVIPTLCVALESFARQASRPIEEFRRQQLTEALATLASGPTTDPAIWIRAGEALALVGDRNNLRHVLQRQKAAQLESPPQPPELVERAMDLVLRAALLRTSTEPWNAAPSVEGAKVLDECNAVARAFLTLERLGKNQDQVDRQLLRIEVAVTLGQHPRALELATPLLASGRLDERARATLTVLAAESQLALGKLDEARTLLAGLPSAALTNGALVLQQNLARGFALAGNGADAVKLCDGLIKLTPESAAGYRERLLFWAETLLRFDKGRREEVVAVLRAKEPMFEAPDAPEPLKRKRAELLRANGN